jgi:adenine deaminase
MPDTQTNTVMDVACVRAAPDSVLVNAQLVNVLTREVYAAEVAIRAGKIAAVRKPGSVEWPASTRIDLEGRFLAPGFIDPHVHIESSHVTVTEYARAVIPHGVVMVAHDPHEIGNVLGAKGIRLMIEEARELPLKVRLRVPGRIPAYPAHMETSNGYLGVSETQELLDLPEAVCLAGDYNPMWVLRQDSEQIAKMRAAAACGKQVSGQAAGVFGGELAAFVAAGCEDTHVAMSVDEVMEDLRSGLRTVFVVRPGRRLGRPHVAQLAALIRKYNLDTRFIQIATDDVYPNHLVKDGHLDQRVRLFIEEGIDPLVAYQMASLNSAEALRIDRQHGSITPGKCADMIVIDDLEKVAISAVLIDGQFVYRDRTYLGPTKHFSYPDWAKATVHIRADLTAEDFQLKVKPQSRQAVVQAMITDAPKVMREVTLPVFNGVVQPDPSIGISALAMIDRHKNAQHIGRAFVGGISLQRGAIASTFSHDAHNIITIGASYDDMVVAVNHLNKTQGGYVIVLDGKVLLEIPLPIAGLMSEQPMERLAEQMDEFERILTTTLGCPPATQIMSRDRRRRGCAACALRPAPASETGPGEVCRGAGGPRRRW